MKIILFKIISILILSGAASAETFSEALKKAYKSNSELNAERESINISEQEHKVSVGAYLPKVTLSGARVRKNRKIN